MFFLRWINLIYEKEQIMRMKISLINGLTGFLLTLLLVAGTSCGNTKKVIYFPDVKDGAISSNTPFPESIIQKGDILSVTITSPDPEAAKPFNTTGGAAAPDVPQGYLVNNDGNIQLPVIGNIKSEGLTKPQLRDAVIQKLVKGNLLVGPTVTIRFTNFRVTVLGEVNKPTVVTVPNEKISLLEALGLAGDLTIYAKRQNVMIIRETKDEKIIKRINLNSDEIFTSPYYYLQSNDIVYVEPDKAKVASVSRGMQWFPIVMSGLSLAIIAVTQLNNK
jgi:polysaccharide export outer membrane protein